MFEKKLFEEKQSRREFLISSGRKIVSGGLAVLGIKLGIDALQSEENQYCEVNLPCRNCFKLGGCEETKAVETRKEIKKQSVKKQKRETDD